MRIDSANIGMESARSYKSASVTKQTTTVNVHEGMLNGGNPFGDYLSADTEKENDEGGAKKSGQGLEDAAGKLRFGGSGKILKIRQDTSGEIGSKDYIRQMCLRYILSMFFGEDKVKEWETGFGRNGERPTLELHYQTIDLSQTEEHYYMEEENTSFSSTGTVVTADGREISFNLNFALSRSFEQYSKETINTQTIHAIDPLVINLDSDVADVSDQTFFIDLDQDGKLDEINQLGRGSGFLALDKNGDGIINDGSELFGTKSGDGFRDLLAYDEDHNGFIDEGDAIFDKLKIWTKDEDGKDVLISLKKAGVGAIGLANVDTEHSLKNAENVTQAIIRKTGIFLFENGGVGTVQHLDMAN